MQAERLEKCRCEKELEMRRAPGAFGSDGWHGECALQCPVHGLKWRWELPHEQIAALVEAAKAWSALEGMAVSGVQRRYNDDFLVTEALTHILYYDRQRIKMVERNIKKRLNLRSVKVHRHNPVGARRFENIGDKLCRNRASRGYFSILPRIAVIWNNGGNTGSGCPPCSVEHNQKFPKVVVDRRTS